MQLDSNQDNNQNSDAEYEFNQEQMEAFIIALEQIAKDLPKTQTLNG